MSSTSKLKGPPGDAGRSLATEATKKMRPVSSGGFRSNHAQQKVDSTVPETTLATKGVDGGDAKDAGAMVSVFFEEVVRVRSSFFVCVCVCVGGSTTEPL